MSCITLGASQNVKFRLSRNSTKLDVVARFRETIPTVKSVSSSEIFFFFFLILTKITISDVYLFIG